MMCRWVMLIVGLLLSGCSVLPKAVHQPTLHNPYPQLSKVAVVPFFNHSSEPTVSGRQFALAYFNELQQVPGFEVIPIGVVEQEMLNQNNQLQGADDARRLARALGADAIVIGVVTDFSPYYPPRCGMQVEWYSTNPGFHPIPVGYGLPWGTPDEEDIPESLVLASELELAREQLASQTPECRDESDLGSEEFTIDATGMSDTIDRSVSAGPNFPSPQSLVPPPPSPLPAACWPSSAPVMRHTRTYNGHDADFTAALMEYCDFRDDARFGGWQNYLQRSDDFIRFCCHKHIWEMLSARGGAGETRVVFQQPMVR